MTFQTNVYGVVTTKTPREVVLVNTVGGCSWHRCAFCEFCNTYGRTALEAEKFNKESLKYVRGLFQVLQIVCSASFVELPMATWFDIADVCKKNGIAKIIIEMHWMHREQLDRIHKFYGDQGIEVETIFGIETFDFMRREAEWFKGYGKVTLEELKKYADSVNLLIGVKGQTMDDIQKDIELAVPNFKRVNVLMFEPNDTDVERDNNLVEEFYNSRVFARYKDDPKVEIMDGLDRRAPDNLGNVGVGCHYD